MSNLSTFSSKSTGSTIILNKYAPRPIVRIAGTIFIFAGLFTLLFYLPIQGNMIGYENIVSIKILSFAGIISGFLTFYRIRIVLNPDSAILTITRDILFRLTRKVMPLSAYDSLYVTYETSNESPVVSGEVNPSVYSLYIYKLYLHSPDEEKLLVELQESLALLNEEPHKCLFVIDTLAQEISALIGKPLNYSNKIKDSLKRLASTKDKEK